MRGGDPESGYCSSRLWLLLRVIFVLLRRQLVPTKWPLERELAADREIGKRGINWPMPPWFWRNLGRSGATRHLRVTISGSVLGALPRCARGLCGCISADLLVVTVGGIHCWSRGGAEIFLGRGKRCKRYECGGGEARSRYFGDLESVHGRKEKILLPRPFHFLK